MKQMHKLLYALCTMQWKLVVRTLKLGTGSWWQWFKLNLIHLKSGDTVLYWQGISTPMWVTTAKEYQGTIRILTGKLVREFIHTNNLSIVNKDQNRCIGGFTRITSNSMSILDLVLEDSIAGHIVDKLEIDEYGDVLGGSDHAALFFSVRLPNNQQKRDGPQDNELFYQRTSCCLSISFQGFLWSRDQLRQLGLFIYAGKVWGIAEGIAKCI